METNQAPVSDPPASPPPAPPPTDLARRLQRATAFVVDGLIGAAIGFPLGFWLGEASFPLGGLGRPLGFVIAVLYFGLCESRIGGGRSIGKRLVRIRVVGADGHPLPVGRALLRASVFLLPLFANGIGFPRLTPLALFAMAVIAVVAIGLGLAIPVTLLFHRRTRQGLHDLVAGAFVVRDQAAGNPISLRAARWPWVFSAVWMAVVAVAAALIPSRVAEEIPPGVVQLLGDEAGVQTWSVKWGERWWAEPGQPPRSQRYAGLEFAYGGPEETGALMQRLARGLIEHDPRAAAADQIELVVQRGWDLGFARYRWSERRAASPAEWLAEPTAEGGSEGTAP